MIAQWAKAHRYPVFIIPATQLQDIVLMICPDHAVVPGAARHAAHAD